MFAQNPIEATETTRLSQQIEAMGITPSPELIGQLAILMQSLPENQQGELLNLVEVLTVSLQGSGNEPVVSKSQEPRSESASSQPEPVTPQPEIVSAAEKNKDQREVLMMATLRVARCLHPDGQFKMQITQVLSMDGRLRKGNQYLKVGNWLDEASPHLEFAAQDAVQKGGKLKGYISDLKIDGVPSSYAFRIEKEDFGNSYLVMLSEDVQSRIEIEVDELLRDVAHSQKNLLSTVIFSADVAGKFWDLPLEHPYRQKGLKNLSLVKNNLQFLALVLDNQLHVSNLGERVNLTRFNLKEELDKIVRVFQDSVNIHSESKPESEKLRVVSDLASLDVSVTTDKAKLGNIFFNIISNARNYTQKGEIKIRGAQEAGNIVIQVSDTGCGIMPADLPFIFDKGFKTNQHHHQNGGSTGLGLSKAKQHSELIGLTIDVESQPDVGTTFTLTFPLIKS